MYVMTVQMIRNNDIDGDGICGDVDNCPGISNPDHPDSDFGFLLKWGSDDGQFVFPKGVAVNSAGNINEKDYVQNDEY